MLDSALAGHWGGVVSVQQSRDETKQKKKNRDQKGLGSNPSFLTMLLANLIEMMGAIIPPPGCHMREKAAVVPDGNLQREGHYCIS